MEFTPEQIEQAEKGPFSHWSTFDMALEGVHYDQLRRIVCARHFEQAKAEAILAEIGNLAQSYGYGVADSFLTDTARMSAEEIEANDVLAITRAGIFDDPGDDAYFHSVHQSDEALTHAPVSLAAARWVQENTPLHDFVERRYRDGVVMRTQDDAAQPAPAP